MHTLHYDIVEYVCKNPSLPRSLSMRPVGELGVVLRGELSPPAYSVEWAGIHLMDADWELEK